MHHPKPATVSIFLFLIWLFDVTYFLLSGQCENHLCDLKSPGNHNNMRNFSCGEKSDWISGADLEQQQTMGDLFQYKNECVLFMLPVLSCNCKDIFTGAVFTLKLNTISGKWNHLKLSFFHTQHPTGNASLLLEILKCGLSSAHVTTDNHCEYNEQVTVLSPLHYLS